MFVGRQSELESLETAYQKGSFQFAVVYGRRRVGKTSLLRAFTQDKPSVIFFTGQQTVASENLALLSREMPQEQHSLPSRLHSSPSLNAPKRSKSFWSLTSILTSPRATQACRRVCKRLSTDTKTRATCYWCSADRP